MHPFEHCCIILNRKSDASPLRMTVTNGETRLIRRRIFSF